MGVYCVNERREACLTLCGCNEGHRRDAPKTARLRRGVEGRGGARMGKEGQGGAGKGRGHG